MKDFDNHLNKKRNVDKFNNQTPDRYSSNNSSNSVFKNICNNSVYDNDYNRSSKNFEEFYKRQKKKM